jgi:outer membrane protein OmpA-like peptidoglycan-associated protein
MARAGAVRVGCAAVPKRLDRAELDRRLETRTIGVGASTRRRALRVLLLTAAIASISQQARADELDLGLFLSPIGRASTLRIEDPAPDRHGTFRLGLTLDYAHDLMDRSLACAAGEKTWGCRGEGRGRPLVADLSRADLSASIALFEVFELGVALPIVLARAAEKSSQALEMNFGAGDMRFGVGVALATQGTTHVGARLDLTFPTAGDHTLSGSPKWSVTPSVIATHGFGRLTFGVKLGYHVRERVLVYDIEQDDELALQLGAAWWASRRLAIITDASARLGVGGMRFNAREAAAELDVGARWLGPGASSFELAVGTNAIPSDRTGLAPSLRVLLSVHVAFEPKPDVSAANAATLDSDGDGFPDDEDACIYDAEDRDGFADDDGCPDIDNDADGLIDSEDACPDRSEDSDGFQDEDGCPEVDNDEDGVPDGADRCRMAPEDRDGFEDSDGCPEPGPAPPAVTLSGSRSLLPEIIYFEGQADVISESNRPMLDELARTLQRLPARKRVRVEGHTDDAGNREHNIDLSYRRAKAVVEYLKSRGVAAERLEYMGYAGSKPLADNRTPEGRALNRRVQFTLIDAPP